MKYLTAEQQPTRYYFLVHTDETKVLEDGSPDPAFVREFEWGLTPPEGQTEAAYIANIKREIGLLIEHELSQVAIVQTPNVPLAGFI